MLPVATLSAREPVTTSAGTDHRALMSFRSAITADPRRALNSWGDPEPGHGVPNLPMCQWRGVACGARGRRRGRVIALDLPGLGLVGSISASLANLTFLRQLDLASNHLNGAVPWELGHLAELEHLNLSGNSITEKIPLLLKSFPRLRFLDLHGNRLRGKIPDTVGVLSELRVLRLKDNMLQGSIPPELGSLLHLQNNLDGKIPDFLSNMQGIVNLNISFNNFKGEVPSHGLFLNASAVSLQGNNGLCGGVPQLKLPPCSNNHITHKWSHFHKIIVAILICSAVVLIFAIFALCKLRNKLTKIKRVPSLSHEQHMRISYAQLVKATDGFASENLLGTGSFGSVYKGTMTNHGQEVDVAVKVINLQQRGASQSFVAECETLRCVRHRNIVKLLTVCSTIDFRGFDFKALVFELMPNGNLDDWLHHRPLQNGNQRVLTLIQRMDIAIDVASAIEYLHHYKPVPIVHCDIKPKNILLDTNNVAHVSDFGLARFMHQNGGSLPEVSSGWATRRGTIGYAAPEYGQGNDVSLLGDTYSYGILLLEMFTGKRPTDAESLGELNLHRHVETALGDQVTDVIDQYLLSETEDGQGSESNSVAEIITVFATSVLHIGIQCSKEMPKDRMQISDAVRELMGIRNKCRTNLVISE